MEKQINMESQNIRSKMINDLSLKESLILITFKLTLKKIEKIRNHWTNLTFMTFSGKIFYNTSNSKE